MVEIYHPIYNMWELVISDNSGKKSVMRCLEVKEAFNTMQIIADTAFGGNVIEMRKLMHFNLRRWV